MTISQQTIDAVKAIPIEEVISKYFQRTFIGSGNYIRCLSFDHQEKSASLIVDRTGNHAHNYGTGAHYSGPIDVLIKTEGLPFPDAVQRLAADFNVPFVQEQLNPKNAQLQKNFLAIELAVAHWKKQLLNNDEARTYLESRQLSQKAIDEWNIGFAPNDFAQEAFFDTMQKSKIPLEVLVAEGLAKEGERGGQYAFLRGRIIVPITDQHGKLVGYTARILPQFEETPNGKAPKYINSPGTSRFNKSIHLFGLYNAKQAFLRHLNPNSDQSKQEQVTRDQKIAREVYITEGAFNIISADNIGIPNVVGTLGTAFTSYHAQLLNRNRITPIFVNDGDKAGVLATRRGMGIAFGVGLNPRASIIAKGADLDDLTRKIQNPEELKTYITQREKSFAEVIVTSMRPELLEDADATPNQPHILRQLNIDEKTQLLAEFNLELEGTESVTRRALLIDEVAQTIGVNPSTVLLSYMQELNARTLPQSYNACFPGLHSDIMYGYVANALSQGNPNIRSHYLGNIPQKTELLDETIKSIIDVAIQNPNLSIYSAEDHPIQMDFYADEVRRTDLVQFRNALSTSGISDIPPRLLKYLDMPAHQLRYVAQLAESAWNQERVEHAIISGESTEDIYRLTKLQM